MNNFALGVLATVVAVTAARKVKNAIIEYVDDVTS